jgi:hypothetical protein
MVLVFAVAALLLGAVLLRAAVDRQPIQASLTRVGGSTRVETALEAARFWLDPPQRVVQVVADAPPAVVRDATRCAIRHDAPLLFTPPAPRRQAPVTSAITRRQALVNKMQDRWSALLDPNELLVSTFRGTGGCPRAKNSSSSDRLSTPKLDGGASSASFIERAGVRTSTTLAPEVVFATAKNLDDAPDVAVAIALAAHLATGERAVSIIAVPRYLHADDALERYLRKQAELIRGGVVVGQTGVFPEDTRLVLRQILVSTDRRGLLGQLKNSLSDLEAVVLAALALLVGAGAAARAIPDAVRVSDAGRWNRVVYRVSEALPFVPPPRSPGPHTLATIDDWAEQLPDGRDVTVRLRSGMTVTGNAALPDRGRSNTRVLRIESATVQSADNTDVEADYVVVPVEDVEFLGGRVRSARPGSGTPALLRRESRYLVAEITASMTGKALPEPSSDSLQRALAETSEQKYARRWDGHVFTELQRLLREAEALEAHDIRDALLALNASLRFAERHTYSPISDNAKLTRNEVLETLKALVRAAAEEQPQTRA